MMMNGINKELKITFVVILCFVVKFSFGQIRTNMNGRLPTENVPILEPNTSQTAVNNGINIGDSFFINKLRQGDSEAITRLGQFQQTVDTPMTLLHNFFQVFSRPDLRQRNGVFGLLHNLAVARGLLPNSLAIGTNGLPIQNTTQLGVSIITTGIPISVTTEIPLVRNEPGSNIQRSNRNIIHSGNINRFSNNEIESSEETHSEEITVPSISRTNRKTQTDTLPLQTVSRNFTSTSLSSQSNAIFPSIARRVLNGNINQRTPDFDRINIGQRQVIQRDRITLNRNINPVVTNVMNNNSNVQTTTNIPEITRKFRIGGRFSLPSIGLEIRKPFQKVSSEQRGARILSNGLQSRSNNRTMHATIKKNSNMIDDLKQSTPFSVNVQPDVDVHLKRPSKLNFMLEMPRAVTVMGRMGTVKPNDIKSNIQLNDSRLIQENNKNLIAMTGNELENNKTLHESLASESKMNNESASVFLLKLTEKRQHTSQNTNSNISLDTMKDFILQRVGHIQLDPTDHVLQVVGEMNLSLAEPEFNVQRVGELNIGRRRQFIMDVNVNSSSADDKVLLQRVGLTNLVPGERLQLHGTGDVRLLTKERVVIQRLGFISFQTDPLKANDQVRSIFTIEPVVNVTLKPSLLFLGRETGAIMNENSNETVLQFVGDVISEMPLDRLNISNFNRSRSVHLDQLVFNSTNVAATNNGDRGVSHNQSIPTSVRNETSIVRDRINESILPVLRENVVTKSKQDRIDIPKTSSIKIHLKSIGRIFSTAELKYENTRADSNILQ